MQSRILAPIALTLLYGVSAAAQDASARQSSVQADIETVYTLPNGTQTRSNGRFYRSGLGQIREDSELGAIITDLKAGTVTILVAQTKEARVMRIPASERTPAKANRPAHELFEESTVDGRRISKSRLTGPEGQRVEFWTAKDLGLVTLTKSEVGRMITVRELKNVSTVEPDPALFTVPSDYTVVEQEVASPGNRPEARLPQRRSPGPGRGRGPGGLQ